LCFPPHMLSRSSSIFFLNQHSAFPAAIPSTPGVLLWALARLQAPCRFSLAGTFSSGSAPYAFPASQSLVLRAPACSSRSALSLCRQSLSPRYSSFSASASVLRTYDCSALPLARYPGLCRLPAIRCCCSPFRITPTWPRLLDLPGYSHIISLHPPASFTANDSA